MLFCFLAPPKCENDPRIAQIIKDHISKKDVLLYDDIQNRPYENQAKKICESKNIKTRPSPRPTMEADMIFALFKDDFDIVKNHN